MQIPIIRFPGRSIQGDGDQTISSLLSMMDQHLKDAAIALNLFWPLVSSHEDISDAQRRSHEQLRRVHQRAEQLTAGIDRTNLSKKAQAHQEWLAYAEAWEKELSVESWLTRLPNIYAHNFLYALDGILKFLGQLQEQPGIYSILEQYKKALPDVKDTRDSAHHADERALRRTHKACINPRTPEFFGASTIVIANLLGHTLIYTKADGELGQVEVSPATLEIARNTVQQAINAFEWDGSPDSLPDRVLRHVAVGAANRAGRNWIGGDGRRWTHALAGRRRAKQEGAGAQDADTGRRCHVLEPR